MKFLKKYSSKYSAIKFSSSKMRFLLTLVFIVVLNACGSTQQTKGRFDYYTDSKKAIKYFEGAMTFYQARQHDDAISFLNKALKKDENFIDAYVLKGNILAEINKPEMAIENYQKAFDIKPERMPKLLYMMAKIELEIGQYEKAFKHILAYNARLDKDPGLENHIQYIIDNSEFGMKQLQNPVPFEPVNMGENINTEHDDYINSINTPGDLLITTVKMPISNQSAYQNKQEEEDFYFSTKDENTKEWNRISRLGNKFNTRGDEGAMKISPDGKMLVFASNSRDLNYGRFDLYYSLKTENGWSDVHNFGPNINTANWESQPILSADGSMLLFVSDRKKDNFGGTDIFYSVLNSETNEWSKPKNIGKPINSRGNEMAPFLHPDGKTLYFSSNGHTGMGKYDFYVSRLDNNGNWSEPQNLGYPINTKGDEIGIVINAEGNLAYISSEREGGFGKLDVYSFELYQDIQANRVNYMRGIVYDKNTNKPLQAEFELVDLNSGEIVINSTSDKNTGSFFVCLPTTSEYGLNVDKNGYLFHSESFAIDDYYDASKPFEKNIYLKPIEKGQLIVLRNIYFETAKYELKQNSFAELNKLLKLLNQNKSMKIEIRGHTDNVGNNADNQLLSENRAKAVYDYLIENGIDKSRLNWKGFGDSMPIESNDTAEGRALNRRTEIKIIE